MCAKCPNCSTEFIERRDTASRCEHCGWLIEVDGQWHPCPEPARLVEPPAQPIEPNVPTPPEPVLAESDKTKTVSREFKPDRLNSNVREYFGGLVTVTETEDDEESED